MAELNIFKLPTIVLKIFKALSPLAGGKGGAGSYWFAQLNSVRETLRRAPIGQHDFTQREPSDQAEFIAGVVNRIPECFENLATGLSKQFLLPNGFVHGIFPCFKPCTSP